MNRYQKPPEMNRLGRPRSSSPTSVDLIAISGPLCAGKTTAAVALGAAWGYRVVAARELIRQLSGEPGATRLELQRLGRKLEERTRGRWIADGLLKTRERGPSGIALDAVRTIEQVEAIRDVWKSSAFIHMTAAAEVRQKRFELRRPQDPVDRGLSFGEAVTDPAEDAADDLAALADVVIDTSNRSIAETAAELCASLARDPGRGPGTNRYFSGRSRTASA